MLKDLSAPRAALFLAALAVVSGLLTNYFPYLPNTDDLPKLGGAPLLPGIYFGVVVCIGVFLWETQKPLALLVVLVGVIIAWILAWRTALSVHDFLDRQSGGLLAAQDSSRFAFNFAVSGLVAGLVGSLGTVFAVSLASPDFREAYDWLRTIALGTVLGTLLHFGDTPNGTFIPLFVGWQAGVAGSVAYGLVIPRPKKR